MRMLVSDRFGVVAVKRYRDQDDLADTAAHVFAFAPLAGARREVQMSAFALALAVVFRAALRLGYRVTAGRALLQLRCPSLRHCLGGVGAFLGEVPIAEALHNAVAPVEDLAHAVPGAHDPPPPAS